MFYVPAKFISKEEYESIIDYNKEMLLEWANRITNHYWNVPFDIPISFNGNLKRTYGWFVVENVGKPNESMKLELAKRLVKHNIHNPFIVEKILKHELCHWYLFVHNNRLGFRDGDFDFETEIQKIDAISQIELNQGLVRIINHIPTKKQSV